MFLSTAFQAHFSKIKLKNYGNRNFQWSTPGKRSLLPFLGRYAPEGDIFVVCETKDFCCRTFGEYQLAIWFLAGNVLASSFPCVLCAVGLEIHDLESELTLTRAG